LECGRARFGRGEFEEAAKALEQAVRAGTERDLLVEARYWLGETLYRLGRVELADQLFTRVGQDAPRGEFAVWALHGNAWAALQLGDLSRARDAFARVTATRSLPPSLDAWARHGLALALLAQGRHEDAEKIWADLERRRVPSDLAREITFWHGEALGRLREYDRAAQAVGGFTQSGPHLLRGVAQVRLGWWRLLGGHPAEAATAFRAFMAGPRVDEVVPPLEWEWAAAGLALAAIATGDADGARQAVRALDDRRSPLLIPVRLKLAGVAVENGRTAEAQALTQDLLGISLVPVARAWVLAVKGDAHRAEGNRDEARTQYDLVRTTAPGSETARYATFRLAQTNLELREFAQAAADVAPLLGGLTTPELRAAALVLQGEAAYQTGDYASAATAYRRLMVEFPEHPQAAAAQLALAWTTLRRGQRDAAAEQFREFARAQPKHPGAVDALELAAELALAAGNFEGGRELLERIISVHGSHPRAEFARLNRAFLDARTGQAAAAQRDLRDWISRAPFPPLVGRAHAALGAVLLATGKPADASREFQRAEKEGLTDFAKLGAAAVALAQDKLDDAVRDFTEARDVGTPAISGAAAYGLAVVAYQRSARNDFKPAALAALKAAPRGPLAPRLLYAMTGLAVEDKDWPEALALARGLVTDFPDDDAADDGLFRVGAGAASVSAWREAAAAFALLRQRYPQSPFVEDSRVTFAEAQLEAGQVDEGRRALEDFVVAAPGDARAPRAWLALGRAREAAGDRPGALEAFGRAGRYGAAVSWNRESLLAYARALTAERRWDEARVALERLLRSAEAGVAGEGAAGIGQTWEGQGDSLAAAEYYLTAAYLAPESPTGRRALLAAARSLAAKQPEAAAILYRKLLAQANVPADLADAARRGLADLPVK
jgi:TolA-binding protein